LHGNNLLWSSCDRTPFPIEPKFYIRPVERGPRIEPTARNQSYIARQNPWLQGNNSIAVNKSSYTTG